MDNKCKLCQSKIKGMSLTCSKGTICKECSGIITKAESQPIMEHDTVLWSIAEYYFKKGKGEKVDFETVWKGNTMIRLLNFEELLPLEFQKRSRK